MEKFTLTSITSTNTTGILNKRKRTKSCNLDKLRSSSIMMLYMFRSTSRGTIPWSHLSMELTSTAVLIPKVSAKKEKTLSRNLLMKNLAESTPLTQYTIREFKFIITMTLAQMLNLIVRNTSTRPRWNISLIQLRF